MTDLKMAAVVINARDLETVVGFWKGLLNVGERNRFPGFVWLQRQPGASVSLAVQQVDDPTEGRNRLHLDFGSSDAAATAARVVELGGRELEQHEIGGFHWTVFGDPEGNEFCIAQADPDDYA
ncbi:MAG TPA: VOC family protein [Egicoccus sp.]|nr:VOC family protein [Egicoccus sp.]HSK23791.1 VOC family protein [Egicoccus sp.]